MQQLINQGEQKKDIQLSHLDKKKNSSPLFNMFLAFTEHQPCHVSLMNH